MTPKTALPSPPPALSRCSEQEQLLQHNRPLAEQQQAQQATAVMLMQLLLQVLMQSCVQQWRGVA